MSFRDFMTAYIECALWSSLDEADDTGGAPLDDNYGPEDIHPDSLRDIEAVCRDFYDAWEPVWRGQYTSTGHWGDDAQAGHDFWLTRNGHGTGFWDRHWEGGKEPGRTITEACRPYGSADIYVGDDGMLHGGA